MNEEYYIETYITEWKDKDNVIISMWHGDGDNELYDNGTWNYKPTAVTDLLTMLHTNPQMFK